MKSFVLLNYNFLFCDHFSQVSDKARLLYIEMMFFAENGFVSNPKAILDARDYDLSTLAELVANGDVLRLSGRNEVFITSYFVHNKGINPFSWKSTPYYIYWKDHLYIKKNGVATFKPLKTEDAFECFSQPKETQKEIITDAEMDDILSRISEGKSHHGVS